MDFRIHIDTIRDCPFCILRGHWYKFLNYDVFLSMKVVLILGLAEEKVIWGWNATYFLGVPCAPRNLN